MTEELTFEEIAFLKYYNCDVKIQTPERYESIKHIYKKNIDGYEIILNDGSSFKCATSHVVFSNNDWVPVTDLKINDYLVDSNFKDSKQIVQINKIGRQEWIDFSVNGECYIQSNVVHHNSGKSLVIYMLLRYFRSQNKKCLVLVPTIDLTSQLSGDCVAYNASEDFMNEIQLIGGEFKTKEIQKPIVFSTWQSAQKSDMTSFDIVITDEVHVAAASVLQAILSNQFQQKIGITGTMPINELDALILESKFGQPKRYINAKQMMELGLSTELTVVPIFLNHGKIKIMKYQDEVKYIKESLKRREFIKKLLNKMTGLTVALYNHTEHGEKTFEDLTGIKMTPKLKGSFEHQKSLGVFFISGSTPSGVRKQIREYLNTSDDGDMIVIGQVNVLSTGINIPRLKNLVFLSSTKSYVKVIQAIGRVLRLHKTKLRAYVYDIVDDMTGTHRKTENYSLKHFWERNAFYQNEQFPILEREINI